MPLLRRALGGLQGLLHRTRQDAELDQELRAFVESGVDHKMRSGMGREDATRAVRLELGSAAAVKDRVRDAGWESVLGSVWQDVRYGGRMLRRSPAFSAIAISILAVGIGGNTAIFSLINAVMLRELPVRDPAQLVELLTRYPGEPRMNNFGWKVYEYFRDQNHVFSDVIGASPARLDVRRAGLDSETVEGELVVPDTFSALGLEPAIGRLIAPEDARPGAAPVAVLSWSYWTNRFNRDPAVLGTAVMINGASVAVVGVAPRAFTGLQTGVMPAIWMPASPGTRLRLMGRLKPGVSIDQARAEMRLLDQWRIEDLAAASHDPLWLQAKMEVVPAAAGFSALRDRFATPLLVLMFAVGLVLLLACTNVAGMLLARGAARRQEIAVRASLGAGPFRIARQVLTESLLLSTAGSVVGVVLGYFGAGALVRIMMSARARVILPQTFDLQTAPDARVLLFTAAIALVTGILFGLAPAWSAFASAPIVSLREIGTAGEKKSGRLFGKCLVAAQVALSVVLLTLAVVFLVHLSNLRNVNLGFSRESVLLVTLNPQGSGYNRVQLTALYKDLLDRLQALPGVRAATLSGVTPIEGPAGSSFATVEGHQEAPADRRRLMLNPVGPKYFETLGTPVLAGREFEFGDANRPRVAIVNESMARHYFHDGNPLGRHLAFDGDSLPYQIVGVVGDAKYADLHEPAPRTVYLNAFQDGRIASQFALRTDVPPSRLVTDVRRTIQDLVPNIRIARVTTLAEQVDASIVSERVISTLSGLLGVLGAALAAVGLYGLLAYTVARRVNEIGVRMAFGATQRDVTRMVVKGALGLVAAGLSAGVPLAIWSAHVAASLVENLPLNISGPIAFAATAMIGVGLLAAYVPARHAARVQPIDALRRS